MIDDPRKNALVINLRAFTLPDYTGDDLIVPWYSNDAARECRHCDTVPEVGYFGASSFQIRCVNRACPVKPWVTGSDENVVRGVWIIRHAVKDLSDDQ